MMMAVWVVITMLLSVEVMMRMVENLVMDVEFVVERATMTFTVGHVAS